MTSPEETPGIAEKKSDAPENNLMTEHENSKEIERGGPKGLEPTRFGDWERKGRCVDF